MRILGKPKSTYDVSADEQYRRFNAARDKRRKRAHRNLKIAIKGGFNIPVLGQRCQ